MRRSIFIRGAPKYREAFGAQYCTIIGSAFAKDEQFDSEPQTHQVSAWTVDDLAVLLEMRANPYEMRDLFAPTVVNDRIMDLACRRNHDEAKRVRIAAQIIAESGWQTQCAAAHGGSVADAPVLTEDAAMLMVDTALAAQGSHVNCFRNDVRAAFTWLTSRLSRERCGRMRNGVGWWCLLLLRRFDCWLRALNRGGWIGIELSPDIWSGIVSCRKGGD